MSEKPEVSAVIDAHDDGAIVSIRLSRIPESATSNQHPFAEAGRDQGGQGQ